MTNVLYINPLHAHIEMYVFGENNTLVKSIKKDREIATLFPAILTSIVELYNIGEIWCITGPGPFTLMRIITLAINALSYTRKLSIKSMHLFDLISQKHTPILEINEREYIVRNKEGIVAIPKTSVEAGVYEGIISTIFSTEDAKYIQYKEDPKYIISLFSVRPCEVRIFPIYFKPPHITCSKL